MISKSIKISSSYFYKSLLKFSNVIVNKPLVPILEDFLIEIKDNKLKITTSDLSIIMYSYIDLEDNYDPISIAIPSKILLDTLKNLPDQPIELIIDNTKNIVNIVSKYGKYKIICDNGELFPVVNINKSSQNIVLKGKTILDSINNTIIVASHDSLKPVINSVLFEFNDNKFTTVATDIHRLIKFNTKLENNNSQNKFVIPKRFLSLISDIIKEDSLINVYFDDKYIYFESSENDVFITTLIKDQYPDYERVIPKNYTNQLYINRLELISALKRLTNYTNGITFQIILKLTENNLELIAEDVNSENNGNEKIDCIYKGNNLSISYNIKYLLEILQNLSTDEVILEFSEPNGNNISNKSTIIKPLHEPDEEVNFDILALIMPIFM